MSAKTTVNVDQPQFNKTRFIIGLIAAVLSAMLIFPATAGYWPLLWILGGAGISHFYARS